MNGLPNTAIKQRGISRVNCRQTSFNNCGSEMACTFSVLRPCLRIAIPYGMMSSRQLRKLAHIARYYDKGYGHFTTRQNIQFNWPRLEEVPDILEELSSVQMHAIQTSGNCIRNITTDQYAGATRDEIEDSRPWAELLRQWSTFHPEFNWLPRKFKIGVTRLSPGPCGCTGTRYRRSPDRKWGSKGISDPRWRWTWQNASDR